MINQVNKNPLNALVYQMTDKNLCTDVFKNIMQYVDTGVPVLRKIRFDNSNIASSPYHNDIDDTIENLHYTSKCCRKIDSRSIESERVRSINV